MSTGVFGAQSSQPLGSTSVFGASSSPASGSSAPAFGATSGSSVFGQKPSFGGFGSSTAPTSPFGGSSFQQSQPAFGSNIFGSTTPFGAPSQPSFGSSSSPAFGAQSASAFGGTSAFGSTPNPKFGSTSGGFGMSSSLFGSNTPAFGASSSSAFGASSTPAFGASSTPAFGASSTPAFGATSTPAFGASSAPAFGSSSSPFNFGSSPAFGQSIPAFGSSPFGTTSSFGVQSASFGAQTTTPTFGQSAFGGQRGGSRVSPYSPTPETDEATGTQRGNLESISAMQVYKDKSHEELRWEDYQLGDKGGPAPAGQSTAAVGFGSSGIGASATPAFGQSSANPFQSTTSPNPFAPKTPAFNNPGFGSSSIPAFGSSPFGTSNTSNLFGSTSSATSSLFGSTPQAFGANTTSSPSLFSSSTSAFGSPSLFGPATVQSSGLNFGNSQSSPLFQSSTPALTQSSPFGQTSSTFGQTASGFGQSNLFSTPSSGFGGNLFSTSSSLLSNSNPSAFGQTTPNLATPFQSAQPAQSSGGFSFSNFGQSQAAGTSGFGGTPGMFCQSAFGQSSGSQNIMAAQAAPITNPFGTLPTMPQMSIGPAGTSPSIQYGISSLPAPTTLFSKAQEGNIRTSNLSNLPKKKSRIEEPSNADAIVEDEIAKVACSPEQTATKSPPANANPRGLGGSTNPVISPLVEQDILNVYEDMGTTESPYVIGEQHVDENRAPLMKSPNEPNNPSVEITSVGAIPHYEVSLTTSENSTDLSATARQTFESDPEQQTNQPIQSPLINTQQIVSIGADIQVQKGFPNALDDPSLIDERSLRVQIEEIESFKIGRSGGVSHSALIPASTEPDGVSWNLGLGTILPGEIEKLKDLSPLQLVQSSFKHMELAKHQIAQLGIQNEDVLFDRSITNAKLDNIAVAHRALIVDVESLRVENEKLLKLNADIATEKERILKEKNALFLVIKNMEEDFKKQIEKAKKFEFNDGFAYGYKQRTQEIVTYLGQTTSPNHNLEL